MKESTFTAIKAFAENHVANISMDCLFQGYDEWHSLTVSDDESWDINFHMCGEPNILHVVAHPESIGADGFMETDTSTWVRIADYPKQQQGDK